MKYLKRPIPVEAIQYTGKNFKEIAEFYPESRKSEYLHFTYITVVTPEGGLEAKPGDYIIRTADGFYPCTEEIFLKNYVPNQLWE